MMVDRSKNRVVWLEEQEDNGQWAVWIDRSFFRGWIEHMKHLLILVGKPERIAWLAVDEAELDGNPRRGHLVRIDNPKNREGLSQGVEALLRTAPRIFEETKRSNERVVWRRRSRSAALGQWEKILDVVKRMAVVSTITIGLEQYVAGEAGGYTPETAHLFRKANSVRHVGAPIDLTWELEMGDRRFWIRGDWKQLKRVCDEDWSALHILTYRIHERLLDSVRESGKST